MAVREDMLADIGRAYYLDGKSKVEIARELGVSRFQVARLLQEARDSGVVRIEIRPHGATADALAERLREDLGLRRVIVVPSRADDIATREELARAAADELMTAARPGQVVGLSWSRTIDRASYYVTRLPECELVQLVGALPVPGSGNSLELLQKLGALSGGATFPVWAPLLVDDRRTAEGLRRHPEIARALERAEHLDVAVVAVAGWNESSTVWQAVAPAERRAAQRAGAVAEFSGRLLDAEGRPVSTGIDERVIAVTPAQLARTPEVIGLATSARAARGVLATVAAGIVTTLIADTDAATAILDLQEASP